jgi:mercuric ion transport protein
MVSAEESTRARNVEGTKPIAGPNRPRLVALGSVLGGIAASSCCILPLLLFSLGAGGAWIGNLTALAPYQPIFVGITFGFLGYGLYLVYWKPRKACTGSTDCPQPSSSRAVNVALWTAALLVAAAIAFPYLAPLLLDA